MSHLTSARGVSYTNISETSNNTRRLYETAASGVGSMGPGGFFMNARDTDARYSIFNEYNLDVNVKYENDSDEITNILATLKPVDCAGHYAVPCMDGTRKHIFEMIYSWLDRDDVDEPNILWLSGIPGAGKSAIASSIVYKLTERKRLRSSFFFRREDVRLSDPAALWRTVAFDLAKRNPTFADSLVESLKEGCVDLERPDINLHFKSLIKEPLMKCCSSLIPPVVVIDALDECGSDSSQETQRNILLDTLIQWSHLPKAFKLIVTGRDDRIPKSFRATCKQMVLPTGNDVDAETNNDIRRFFEQSLDTLPHSTFLDWPKEQVLDNLTVRASGLFIWAKIVTGVLKQGLPEDQLRLILNGHLGTGDHLSDLYRKILDTSFRDIKDPRALEVAKLTISIIVLAKVPFHRNELHIFLSERASSVDFIINKLSSVIFIGEDSRLRIRHLSFSEFLCDPNRCSETFFIDRDKACHDIAMTCFFQMKKRLKFNICDLETSYLPNNEVGDLSERIKKKITGPLIYSCRYWAAHLRDITNVHGTLLEEVKDFFYDRFLFWLEVMSLVEQIPAANPALMIAIPWIEEFDTSLSAFAQDARRFVINFDLLISESVPHIYLSALPFAPSTSLIVQQYQPLFPNILSVLSGRSENWPAMVNHFRGHIGSVNCVAFSPDGKRVASGSDDWTIRIWDMETGQATTAGLWEGHTYLVNSVAFSPDGRRVASGSSDGSIRIWDGETGKVTAARFMESGYIPYVNSVAFFPDGKRVASALGDGTIWILDAETGQINTGPFKGHADSVNSVACSPDGKRVVSGSSDSTIRIWDVETGKVTTTGHLEGHVGSVTSIAFSPDGKRIVSGSNDMTIRIWDAEIGQVIAGPLRRHTGPVTSVAFSPDCQRVVSGSYDSTIRIWDIETGQVTAVSPLEGNTYSVKSVMFSPDGKQVVSGSSDMIIRIWDVKTGQVTESPSGDHHLHCVESVAFSPDGKRVVSGSFDNAVRILDVEIGQIITGPLEGHTFWVNSVAFSPDGKRVASGSSDKTIRIWDVETAQVTAAGLLKGHTHSVTSIAFSPDGKRVLSFSLDDTIRIWDVETGQVIAVRPLQGNADSINTVMFSADGKQVVSGSSDMIIRIWDVETGQATTGPFKGHTGSVTSVAFSQDGKQVVSGSYDNTIRIWDVEAGQVTVGPLKGHDLLVSSVAFSPDGQLVVSGSYDSTIRIWDVKTGRVIGGPLEGHTGCVNSVAFSPDGRLVVSGSDDRTVHVWDVGKLFAWVGSHLGIARSFGCGYRLNPNSGWSYVLDGADSKHYLLLWVPREFRIGFHGIATHVVFGPHPIQIDFDKFKHGTSWTQCYSPDPILARFTPVSAIHPRLQPTVATSYTNTDSKFDELKQQLLLCERSMANENGDDVGTSRGKRRRVE